MFFILWYLHPSLFDEKNTEIWEYSMKIVDSHVKLAAILKSASSRIFIEPLAYSPIISKPVFRHKNWLKAVATRGPWNWWDRTKTSYTSP